MIRGYAHLCEKLDAKEKPDEGAACELMHAAALPQSGAAAPAATTAPAP